MTVFGNGLVIFVVLNPRHRRRLSSITYKLLANLAAADFLVGLFGNPSAALQQDYLWPPEYYSCLFLTCFRLSLTRVSMCTFLAIALERFVAIRFPFTYQKHFQTRGKAVILLAVIWLTGFTDGMIPLYGWNLGWNLANQCDYRKLIPNNYSIFGVFVEFIPFVTIITIVSIYVFMVVRRHSRQIATLEVATPTETSAPTNNTSDHAHSLKRELKAAKKCFIIIQFRQ